MERGHTTTVLLLTIVLVVSAAAGVATVGADTSTQEKADDGTWLAPGTGGYDDPGRENDEDQQYPGNTSFKIDDHAPGASGNSFNIFAVGLSENNRMFYNVVNQPDFDWSGCTSADARAFGIDRGNDDPGTNTDRSLLDAYQSVNYHQDGIVVEFYKEDQLAGGPVNVTVNDQIVSRVANCLQNPQEEGWYRLTGYINGSTKMDTQQDYTIHGAAKYVYIGDYDSRQAAIDALGPPPQDCPRDGDWTCRTEDGEYYSAGESPGGNGNGDQQNGDGTPTDDQNGDQQNGDGTPTDDQNGDQQNGDQQNESPTDDDGTPTDDQTGDDATATTGETGDGDPGGQDTDDDATPTEGNGPGFGVLLSLGGLLAAALLVLRRR